MMDRVGGAQSRQRSTVLCYRSQKNAPRGSNSPPVRNRNSWISTSSSFPRRGTVCQGSPADWALLSHGGDLHIDSPWISFHSFPVSLPQTPASASWDLLWADPQQRQDLKMYSVGVIRTLFLHSTLSFQGSLRLGLSLRALATDWGMYYKSLGLGLQVTPSTLLLAVTDQTVLLV